MTEAEIAAARQRVNERNRLREEAQKRAADISENNRKLLEQRHRESQNRLAMLRGRAY